MEPDEKYWDKSAKAVVFVYNILFVLIYLISRAFGHERNRVKTQGLSATLWVFTSFQNEADFSR